MSARSSACGPSVPLVGPWSDGCRSSCCARTSANQPVVHDSMLYMLQVMAEPYHEHYAYRPEWSLRRVEAVKSAAKRPTTPRAKQPVAQSADA